MSVSFIVRTVNRAPFSRETKTSLPIINHIKKWNETLFNAVQSKYQSKFTLSDFYLYFISSCFFTTTISLLPTPCVGMCSVTQYEYRRCRNHHRYSTFSPCFVWPSSRILYIGHNVLLKYTHIRSNQAKRSCGIFLIQFRPQVKLNIGYNSITRKTTDQHGEHLSLQKVSKNTAFHQR